MEISGNKKCSLKIFILCTLTGVLLYVGAYFFRHLLFWLIASVPLPYIITRVYCGKSAQIVALAVLLGFACAVSGPLNALILIIPIVGASLICGYVLVKHISPYYTLLYCCTAAFLSVVVFMALLYALRGLTVQGMLLNLIKSELESTPDATLKVLYKYLSAAQSGKQLTPEMLNPEIMAKISPDVAKSGLMRILVPVSLVVVPEVGSVGVCLFGLLYAVIPLTVCKKSGCKLAVLPPFYNWQLPDNLGYWAMGLYIGALLSAMADLRNFDIVFAIVSGAFSFVFTLQGLALFDWILKKRMGAVSVRILIMALSWLLTSAISLFVWIGLLEQFAKFRRRY